MHPSASLCALSRWSKHLSAPSHIEIIHAQGWSCQPSNAASRLDALSQGRRDKTRVAFRGHQRATNDNFVSGSVLIPQLRLQDQQPKFGTELIEFVSKGEVLMAGLVSSGGARSRAAKAQANRAKSWFTGSQFKQPEAQTLAWKARAGKVVNRVSPCKVWHLRRHRV